MCVLGCIFLIINFNIVSVITIIISCTLIYIIYYFGGFGGADAKALISLSILIPVYPVVLSYPLWGVPVHGLFVMSVLGNALLFASIIPFMIFGYNMVIFIKDRELPSKLYYLFIGYKKTPRSTYFKILSDVNGVIWIAPMIPFMIMIFMGVISAMICGDCIIELINCFSLR